MIRTNETPRDAARDVKEEFRRGSPDDVERAAERLGASAAARMEQGMNRASRATESGAERVEQRMEHAGSGSGSGQGGMGRSSRPKGKFGRWKQEAQQAWSRVKDARTQAERALQETKSEASAVQNRKSAQQAQGSSSTGESGPPGL